MSSALLQIVVVCIIVAFVATANAYPGYYGHEEYEHLSAGEKEDDKNVSDDNITV